MISGPVKAVAGGPVASIASRRATGGGEAYTARKQAVRIQLRVQRHSLPILRVEIPPVEIVQLPP